LTPVTAVAENQDIQRVVSLGRADMSGDKEEFNTAQASEGTKRRIEAT